MFHSSDMAAVTSHGHTLYVILITHRKVGQANHLKLLEDSIPIPSQISLTAPYCTYVVCAECTHFEGPETLKMAQKNS